MRPALSRVTSKGQVTIPVQVRRALGVEPHDTVAFLIEEGGVRLVRRGSVAERTAGIFKADRAPLSAEELRRVAEDAIAADVLARAES